MNIAIDGRSSFFYNGSGIGNYSNELIKHMIKINKSNSIDIFSKEVNINKSNSFWSFSNVPIKLNKHYDLFFNPHNGIGLPLNGAQKFLTTLHDIIPSKLPNTVSKTYLKIFNKNIYHILNKSNAIITVSNYSKNDISKTFSIDKNKIFVTYLAPSKIYRPINKIISKNFLKKTFKIDFNYILYVGSSSPRKNILRLIESFSKIHKKNPTIKLLIVGANGKSCENYLNRTRQLHLDNNIIFIGFVKKESLPYLYNGAICFIYPSLYEGFGLPPLEAMACGTPVITSNITSIPEILKDNVIYVDPYNINSIYENTNLLLNDPKIKNAFKRKSIQHSKNFSWYKTSKETLEIFKKI